MGEVYLARDTRLGRRVALKLLHSDVTRHPDRVNRFQQEARAASALNHPGIITIFDVGEIDGAHFIATEFIDGQTLRERISTSALSMEEVLEVAVQVSTALSAAHANGIMHRDIKPDNIMIRRDGYVKVLDFGLAKLTETSGQQRMVSHPDAETQPVVQTDPGTVMGTVSYMSPEQARGIAVDERTDIFSLGVVIYEMVAGRVPFEAPSVSEVIVAILKKRPLPLARFATDVPNELERIVAKTLSKSPDERYQTIKDLLIDLRRLKQQIELDSELEYSGAAALESGLSYSSDSGGQKAARVRGAPTQFMSVTEIKPVSSAEYIISEIKRHKRSTLLVIAILFVVGAGLTYYVMGAKPIETVAVLPLANSGDDPNAAHLGEILTQRLISRLSKMPNVRVKSFSTVARFSGQSIDPAAVGRELSVQALLVGSITKRDRDDNVSVSVELVNTKDGSQLWGEQFDYKFADIRQVQEAIIRGVAERIGPRPGADEIKARRAEELYAEGRNYWEKRTADAMRRALDSFQRAIEIRPDYAQAHAGIADCHNMLAAYGASSPEEAFPKATAAARRALELDDKLAEAHTALAYAKFRGEWDWAGAEREFKRAIELNYDYAQAHQWYGNYLVAMGRPEEAIEEARRTLALDPTSLIIQAHFGFIDYFAHRYDEAIAESQKTLRLDPNFFAARRYLGLSYSQKGMHAQAIAEFQRAVGSGGGSPVLKAELANTLGVAGRKDEARRILQELLEQSKTRHISPYHIAIIYAGLEDREKAFEWLEKAFTEKADFIVYMNVDPRLKLLHADERFEALRERLGL